MAAAVALASRGVRVVVYEAARRLGGRARAVEHEGAILDNGQHLLIGAYRHTLALLDQVGSPRENLLRLPLAWHMTPEFSFAVADLPAPWHLALGLVRARGIGLAERYRVLRFLQWCRRNAFRLAEDTTAADLLARHEQHPQLVRSLWEPLCVAALNTPLASASAQVFLAVLRDGLAADRSASDLLLPRVDLSTLFPDPAARFVQRAGGEIRCNVNVQRIDSDTEGFVLATDRERTAHAAVIVATQPYRVASLVGHFAALAQPLALIAALTYQPIITVYLRYERAPRLPAPMTGLAQSLTQWVFDRAAISAQPGLVAGVISAHGRQQALTREALAASVHADISGLDPSLPTPRWSQVIEERRATFACTPGLARPAESTAQAGLFLAGDYVQAEYPATIESAVTSGLRCAELAHAYLQENG
jgi:squalene-associated FAD-dependent desaturase